MDSLVETVKNEVAWYSSGGGHNLLTFPFVNDELQAYAVLIVDTPIRKQAAGIVVFARVINDLVLIEEDKTDRPLYQTLEQLGIPREKIICTYAGEVVPPEIAEAQEKVHFPVG